MFEFSIALRYLLPNRKQKTLSFVAVLASLVIAVVLWLLLVFVSITQSIENQWLNKMTALSAPLRIKPTKAYYNSYYYLIDEHAEASRYALKNLKEKFEASQSDPFNPEVDENIAHLPLPHRNEYGQLIDPVKKLNHLLKASIGSLIDGYEEFVLSAGALHLNLKKEGAAQTLNQILYLTNYTPSALQKGALFESWDREDLNHLILNPSVQETLWPLEQILKSVEIQSIQLEPFKLKAPPASLVKKGKIEAYAELNAEGKIQKILVECPKDSSLARFLKKGVLDLDKKRFDQMFVSEKTPIYIGSLEKISLEGVKHAAYEPHFLFKATALKQTQFFELKAQDFRIQDFSLKASMSSYLHPLFNRNSLSAPYPILVPKNFKEQGAKVGDKGFISYGAKTLSGFQEMKAQVLVAGFYDPGIFSVGAKVVIGPRELIDLIGTHATTYALDATETNGYLLFNSSFKNTNKIKKILENKLKEEGIDLYFKVETYEEYPFVKEILEQFSSDKLIFYLVGLIIFIVALSNVAFLMQLLVRDKSHEMAILRSLGASLKNLERIFIFSGVFLGIFSATIAILLAYLTLFFIEPILHFLGHFMGQNPIHSLFYGASTKVYCDLALMLKVLIFTPILCALAAKIATFSFRKKSPSQFLKEPRL